MGRNGFLPGRKHFFREKMEDIRKKPPRVTESVTIIN